MDVILAFITLFLLNIFGFALPSVLAAWLLALVFPVAFSQALWLSLGTIIFMTFVIQNLADIPGQFNFGLLQIIFSVVVAYVMLFVSGLFGYGLSFLPLDLTLFEFLLLATISLNAGVFFLFRSGSGGLPKWMTIPMIDIEEEFEDDDDYIIQPPTKPKGRKSRRRRR